MFLSEVKEIEKSSDVVVLLSQFCSLPEYSPLVLWLAGS